MHTFDLPRRYRIIYICYSFGLAGSRQLDLETLRCCHRHLEADGALVLNIQAEYTSADDWGEWTSEHRRSLPEPWPEEGSRRALPDGSESVGYFRFRDLNPLEQTYARDVRLEKWSGGELAAKETYSLHGNMHLKNELLLMLRVAGFDETAVYGNYGDLPATVDHEELVFVATKSSGTE